MKNNIKYYIFLVLIIIFGFAIRLINLDKNGGLWYDEITIYSISQNFSGDLKRFLQFPIYYVFYKFWICILGNSDFVIRLMSVIFDILSLFMTFVLTKNIYKIFSNDEIQSIKAGLVSSSLYAVNSSFIYYAQEAKFYSFTFFAVLLFFIFWIKFLDKNCSKINFVLFYLSTLILLYSNTCQIVLIMFAFILMTVLFVKRNIIKQKLSYLMILSTVFIPLIIFLIRIKGYFTGNFDAVVFDNSFTLSVFQNYFSPILIGVQNNVLNYQKFLIKHLLDIKYLVYVLIPVIISIFGILYSVKKSVICRYLFLICSLYLVFHLILPLFSSYKPLVRYTLFVLPIFISLLAVGLKVLTNKYLKRCLFAVLIFINAFCLILPSSALFIQRPDGYKTLADFLKVNNIPNNANFILPIRENLLDKYYKIRGEKLSLYILNSDAAQKTYLTNDEINGLKNDNGNKQIYYKRFLTNDKISEEFIKFVDEKFSVNKPIVLITDKSICVFNNQQISQIVQSSHYSNYALQFLRLSKLNNDLLKVLKLRFKRYDVYNSDMWDVYVFY